MVGPLLWMTQGIWQISVTAALQTTVVSKLDDVVDSKTVLKLASVLAKTGRYVDSYQHCAECL